MAGALSPTFKMCHNGGFLRSNATFAHMTKQDKANYVMQALEELYPEVPIPLDHSDAFTVACGSGAFCTMH